MNLTINDCLLRIKSLVESPHWTADRKERISELCDIAISQLPGKLDEMTLGEELMLAKAYANNATGPEGKQLAVKEGNPQLSGWHSTSPDSEPSIFPPRRDRS